MTGYYAVLKHSKCALHLNTRSRLGACGRAYAGMCANGKNTAHRRNASSAHVSGSWRNLIIFPWIPYIVRTGAHGARTGDSIRVPVRKYDAKCSVCVCAHFQRVTYRSCTRANNLPTDQTVFGSVCVCVCATHPLTGRNYENYALHVGAGGFLFFCGPGKTNRKDAPSLNGIFGYFFVCCRLDGIVTAAKCLYRRA